MRADHDELRRLAEAATAGPWGWRGNDDGLVELRGHGPFGRFDGRVVSTLPAEPCIVPLPDGDAALTDWACVSCQAMWAEWDAADHSDMWEDYRCPKERSLSTLWLTKKGVGIQPANTWAVREVPYRTDVASVDHPDAQYIAAVSPDVVLALLDEIEGMDTLLDALLCGCGDALDDVHRPGGKCGNCLAADDEPAVENEPDPNRCPAISRTWGRLCLPADHGGRVHELNGGYGFAEGKLVDLMAALAEIVDEAKAARDRHQDTMAVPDDQPCHADVLLDLANPASAHLESETR